MLHKNLGFTISSNEGSIRKDAFWFGEAQSRAVVSVRKDDQSKFEQHLTSTGIAHELLGAVKGKEVVVNGENWGTVENWKNHYDDAITNKMVK